MEIKLHNEKTKDKISMRDAFGLALLSNAENNQKIYAVSADTENSMCITQMARKYPNRVLNVGIGEQNMALTAVGLATCGAKVFMASYSTFTSMRILEQLRTYIAYSNLDVKIIAGMGGLSGSMEGYTHQGIEEVSIIRSIPNMKLIVAADACSTEEIINVISESDGPVYVSIGRYEGEKIFDLYSFEMGKGNILRYHDKSAASIFCNGPILSRVLQVESVLSDRGCLVNVIEMPCVKPLDEKLVIEEAKRVGKIVVIEEGTVIGGLGGAICECVSFEYPIPVLRIGINDFFTGAGPYDELLDEVGFSVEKMTKKIIEFVEKRSIMVFIK